MQLKIIEIFDEKEIWRLGGMTEGCTNADFTCSVEKFIHFFTLEIKKESYCGREY